MTVGGMGFIHERLLMMMMMMIRYMRSKLIISHDTGWVGWGAQRGLFGE